MTALPDYIDKELWAAFIESRQAMKVPFTPRAQMLVIRKLMGMHASGWDPNASLEKSAIYGYRGVFEVARYPSEMRQRDPALEKLDADKKTTSPPSPEMREKMKRLTARVMEAAK